MELLYKALMQTHQAERQTQEAVEALVKPVLEPLEMAVLGWFPFVTQTHSSLPHQQLDHQQLPLLVVIVITHGQVLDQLRSKVTHGSLCTAR